MFRFETEGFIASDLTAQASTLISEKVSAHAKKLIKMSKEGLEVFEENSILKLDEEETKSEVSSDVKGNYFVFRGSASIQIVLSRLVRMRTIRLTSFLMKKAL